jgi:hypothetical protein
MTIRGWGAPFVAGVAPGRSGANGERHGELQGRQRRRGTAERHDSGAPARPTWQCRALERKQASWSFSSPPCESPEDAHDGWETAAARSNGDGARVSVGGGGP